MSPQVEQRKLTLPPAWTLETRPAALRADELPTLRDERGRVRATVEAWRPS